MNHTLTISLPDLTGLTGTWPVVRLVSRHVGDGPLITNEGYGQPRILVPDPQGMITIENLQATADYTVQQEYSLVIGSKQFIFAMPDADSSVSALVTVLPDLGPVIVSTTEPTNAGTGQIWLNPTNNVTSIRSGGVWHPIVGAGGGLNLAAVNARIVAGVKDFARTGGDAIDLQDTDFTVEVEDAINITKTTWTASTRTLLLKSNDDAELSIPIPDYDASELEARLSIIETFESVLRSRTSVADAVQITMSASNAAYAIPGATLPLTGTEP